nr:hypothetical protein [uncultured Brevundimonas sp.]
MLDPLFEWFGRLLLGIAAWLRGLVRLVLSPFRSVYRFYQRSGIWMRLGLGVVAIPLIAAYAWFFWQSAWIRDYDPDYPDRYSFDQSMRSAGEQVAVEGGDQSTKTCGESAVVKITGDLIDLNVNKNVWLSSNPVYKAGFFWMVDWDQTWFFDNKAAFQRGVHQAASRTAIELVGRSSGRARGTSQIDDDLQSCQGQTSSSTSSPGISTPFGPPTLRPHHAYAHLSTASPSKACLQSLQSSG